MYITQEDNQSRISLSGCQQKLYQDTSPHTLGSHSQHKFLQYTTKHICLYVYLQNSSSKVDIQAHTYQLNYQKINPLNTNKYKYSTAYLHNSQVYQDKHPNKIY